MKSVPPHLQILAFVAFVLAEVALPRELIWPYLVNLALLLGLILGLRIPLAQVAWGLLIEVPFVIFALLLPVVATGERVWVAGLSLSRPGLWAAWAILAKGTLGVLAAVILATQVSADRLIVGLARLRLPKLLVQILSFTVRYLAVIRQSWRQMTIARASRGFVAASPRSWGVLSASLGSLFIRSYERGERVHFAMLSRGYRGGWTLAEARTAVSPQAWMVALLPSLSWLICALAWLDWGWR